jgi:hypothetical protein
VKKLTLSAPADLADTAKLYAPIEPDIHEAETRSDAAPTDRVGAAETRLPVEPWRHFTAPVIDNSDRSEPSLSAPPEHARMLVFGLIALAAGVAVVGWLLSRS